MKKLLVIFGFAVLGLAFTSTIFPSAGEQPVPIPPSKQRTGDAETGFTYLTTGDYLKSGIPLSYFRMMFRKNSANYLKREGENKEIPYDYTAVRATNGELVVAPNCLQCHAQVFDGKLIIGLGNSTVDFTQSQKLDPKNAAAAEKLLKNVDPKKYEAAEPFLRVVKAVGAKLTTQVRGVNIADRLAALLVSHRDPNTFRWSDSALLQVPDEVIPTDVPPWWLLWKKNAMFYNGFGRGDFGRFLMASNLFTVNDTSESREVDSHFNDVLAYIQSLRPPPYPKQLNKSLVKEGGVLFVRNCSKCHGSYGNGEKYPNLLIPETVIRTDSLLFKSNYQSPQFVAWFNSSWFSQGDHPARLEPFDGYIAPPLDGIWITAPYLHNGSVPDLETLLNSKERPKYWSRDFDDPQYNYEDPGWKYQVRTAPEGTSVYNTTLPGYGNYGHTFGDKLSKRERKAIIEYLKTL
ncbi:MAG: c-type cytochrome [Bacteroidota bacterium]|nr:c-type cytochrome [Bacteroidota bacterium]